LALRIESETSGMLGKQHYLWATFPATPSPLLPFFLWYWGLNSGPIPWATPPTLFVIFFFFWDRVSQTICPGWLWATILLISASWVARITSVSYQHPAPLHFFLRQVALCSSDWPRTCNLLSLVSTMLGLQDCAS
jgi:hypothetical protein